MRLATPFGVGALQCHLLDAGAQRLDGGAMFGVVPKSLWQKRIAADEQNRIPLALRCLLIEHPDGLVLVDSGIGNKESDKFKDIYGVRNDGRNGPTRLEDAIAEVGFSPDDVRYVINTHLHFDHAGGNTRFERPGQPEAVPSFPRAKYVVQRGELAFAARRNERIAASYFPANFDPIGERAQWKLVDGASEILPGVRVLPTPGHTPHHQSVMVESAGQTACYVADLVPTTAHVPLPWIMGYDLEPLVTLETKRQLLGRAESEGWLMVFEHDPEVGLGRIEHDAKSFICKPLDTPEART